MKDELCGTNWMVLEITVVYNSCSYILLTYVRTLHTERDEYILCSLFLNNPMQRDGVQHSHQRGVAVLWVTGTEGLMDKRFQDPPQIVYLYVEISTLPPQQTDLPFTNGKITI